MIDGTIDLKKLTDVELEMVGEQILYESGSFSHVRRWVKGKHPHLGKILYGHTGWETEIEMDVIKPLRLFSVVEVVNEDKPS